MGILKKFKKVYDYSRGDFSGLGDKGKKDKKQQIAKTQELLDMIQQQQSGYFDQQGQAMQSALTSINQSRDAQLGELNKVYGHERRLVKERGQQTFAQGSQDLSRRGLGNTTITGGLHRGVGADVNRGMGALTAAEAGQRSNVIGNAGTQTANTYGMLANIYGQQAAANTNLGLASLPGNTAQYQSTQNSVYGLLGGAALGGLAGGPAGASVGASVGQTFGSLFDY